MKIEAVGQELVIDGIKVATFHNVVREQRLFAGSVMACKIADMLSYAEQMREELNLKDSILEEAIEAFMKKSILDLEQWEFIKDKIMKAHQV